MKSPERLLFQGQMYKQDLHHWHLLSLPHHHDQIYISSQPDDGAGWCKEEAEPTIDELPPPTFKFVLVFVFAFVFVFVNTNTKKKRNQLLISSCLPP